MFFIISLLVFYACAKKPAIIQGHVTNADGEPLAGAIVSTIPMQLSSETDSTGYFIVVDVPPGIYSIMAKFEADSTVKMIGEVAPGATVASDIKIVKQEPLIPPEPEPVVEEPKPKPKPKPPIVDPVINSGVKVLHLATLDFIRQYEVESSDGLVWTLRKEKEYNPKFRGGRLFDGYFAGPYHEYWETAGRMLEYDGKIWLYVHGPEKVVDNSRAITIAIPLGLPSNTEIDSIVVEYGLPKIAGTYPPGTVQLRMLGETVSDITPLMDWHMIDHDENGLLKKEVISPRGAARKLEYVIIEVDSDGDAYWDALMIRPLVYFELR
jgi:hypothetical protein